VASRGRREGGGDVRGEREGGRDSSSAFARVTPLIINITMYILWLLDHPFFTSSFTFAKYNMLT
jgi:hypothetical protein